MGNIRLNGKQNFDETHPKFQEFFNKIDKMKCNDDFKFKLYFSPLTSNKIPLNSLSKYFKGQNVKTFNESNLKYLYLHFFYKQDDQLTHNFLQNLCGENNEQLNTLFEHKIDKELKEKIQNYKPNQTHFGPLALGEMNSLTENSEQQFCKIIKCDCPSKIHINNKNEIEMYNYFKRIVKENNSNFPLKKLSTLIQSYNKYCPELSKIIIDYLKRELLNDFLDNDFLQTFFVKLLSCTRNDNENEKLKLIYEYCTVKADRELTTKNINYLLYKTESVSVYKGEIRNAKEFINKLNDTFPDRKELLINALDSLSLIPFIEFEELVSANGNFIYIYKFITLIVLSPLYQKYLNDIIKAQGILYCFRKEDFKKILDDRKNTKEFEHDNYKFSFDNIIDGNVFRLKKGIDYKETIIFIDYSMFKFIKSSCIPYDISKWTDYLTVTTIKYEITNDSEISKDAIYVKEGNIIYEIEVEPVCVDLYYATKGNKTSIINDNNIPQEISSFSPECFSRKTQLKEVISKMKVKCSKNNVLNNKLNEDYVLDKDKNKININDKEKTLEQYKLSDQIFFVIDFYNDFSECKDITTTNEIKDNEEQYGMKNEEQINNVQYQEEKVFEDNTNIPLRFSNTSNICFLNSVMQLFINLPLFKECFILPKYVFINEYSKTSHGGVLAKAFLETLKIRWNNDLKKKKIIYNLSDFKKIFGSVIKQFASSENQDADEFLNIILDELNEEFNLKYLPEQTDNLITPSDKEFQNVLNWSNTIRKSTSIINAIFSFQLQSILTCQECKRQKISYEFNRTLFVAVPEPKQIQFRILLYKLPFELKLYYDKINKYFENELNGQYNKIQQKLKDFSYNELIQSEDFQLKIGICPISIDFKIDKDKTINDLVDMLREDEKLELEKTYEFTSLFVYGQTKEEKLNNKKPSYYEGTFTIEQCIQNKQDVYIYEVLNSNGLRYLNNKITPSTNIQKNEEEFKIAIIHFVIKKKNEYLFRQYQREPLPLTSEYIILKNNIITGKNLYTIILLKYCKYFKCKKPYWWEDQSNGTKNCYPFTIKIMERANDKDILTCPNCGWWRFCTGCVLDPNQKVNINDTSKSVIVVDWCNSLCDYQQITNRMKYVIEYNYFSEKDNNIADLTLQQCLDNHFEIECLDVPIKCESCQKKTSHTKQCLFDSIMPPVLIITLNRFKYTKVFRTKLDNLIEYPLYDLQINNDVYDLYGIINHIGTLNNGHFTSILKIMNNNLSYDWMSFNDTNYDIIPENKVVNKNAYILVYINKNYKEKDYLNLVKDMMTNINPKEIDNIINSKSSKEYKEYPSKFYKGEPIHVNSIYGCFYEQEDSLHSTIITQNGKEKIENSELQHDVLYEINSNIIEMNLQNKSNSKITETPTKSKYNYNNCVIF